MAKLFTEVFISRVQEALEDQHFRREDFTINKTSDDDGYAETYANINIVLIAQREFTFSIDANRDANDTYVVQYSPAGMRPFCRINVEPEKVTAQISVWLEAVWQEISSNPIGRIINDYVDFLNELREKASTIPEEPFGLDQIDRIIEWLDDLEGRVADLEAEVSDKIRFNEDLETLKATVKNMDKPSWYLLLIARMDNWLSKPGTPFQLLGGIEAARQIAENAGLG